jgi:hypothetical protein
MFVKKIETALEGEFGALGIVARTVVAVEPVLHRI